MIVIRSLLVLWWYIRIALPYDALHVFWWDVRIALFERLWAVYRQCAIGVVRVHKDKAPSHFQHLFRCVSLVLHPLKLIDIVSCCSRRSHGDCYLNTSSYFPYAQIDSSCPSVTSYYINIASSIAAKVCLAIFAVLVGLPAFIIFTIFSNKLRLNKRLDYENLFDERCQRNYVTPPGGLSACTSTDNRTQLQRYIEALNTSGQHTDDGSVSGYDTENAMPYIQQQRNIAPPRGLALRIDATPRVSQHLAEDVQIVNLLQDESVPFPEVDHEVSPTM